MRKTIILSLLTLFSLGMKAQTTITTVADQSGSGRYFAKLCPSSDVAVSIEDAKVFSFYLSNGVALFQSVRVRGGRQVVTPNDHVVIFTFEPKEITLESVSGIPSSVWPGCDDVFTLDQDQSLESFRAEKGLTYRQYIYRLTNNAASGGFGFTYFTGTTMKAGQFFIITTLKPNANGRLEVEWLDEDGNEIQNIQTGLQDIFEFAASDDNAVYTLQGIRVATPQKGQLYIHNGQKYVYR